MSTGTRRGATATTRNARNALVILLSCAALAGCGGGGDETEETPRKALVPAAMDDTSYAAPDTTAWQQMGGTPAEEEAFEEDRAPAESAATLSATADRPQASAGSPASASATPSAPAAAPAEGPFVLQLGSFRSLDNARRQADRIRALGHDPVIEASTLGGQTYHRVVLRGLPDHAAAASLGERIHAELGITYLVRRAD